MPTEIAHGQDTSKVGIIADRALYTTADGRVVEEGDKDAAFLLAARGSFIEAKDVKRLGLSLKGGKVASDEEAVEFPTGEPTEGRIDDGRPFVPVPRTGVIRTEPAPVVIPEPGTEFDPAPTLVVSNMPETEEQKAEREEMVEKAEAAREAGKKAAEKAAKEAAKESAPRAAAKKAGRKG